LCCEFLEAHFFSVKPNGFRIPTGDFQVHSIPTKQSPGKFGFQLKKRRSASGLKTGRTFKKIGFSPLNGETQKK